MCKAQAKELCVPGLEELTLTISSRNLPGSRHFSQTDALQKPWDGPQARKYSQLLRFPRGIVHSQLQIGRSDRIFRREGTEELGRSNKWDEIIGDK